MMEATLRLEGLNAVRIFRVVKSNSSVFPIGLELRDPTFSTVLARLTDGSTGGASSLPVHTAAPATEPEMIVAAPALTIVPPAGPTLQELLAKATELGFSRAQLITAARHYCNGKDDLERLTPDEIVELDRRLTAHASRHQDVPAAHEGADLPDLAVTGSGRTRRGQA